jgi:iron complex outermembrane receptor protein
MRPESTGRTFLRPQTEDQPGFFAPANWRTKFGGEIIMPNAKGGFTTWLCASVCVTALMIGGAATAQTSAAGAQPLAAVEKPSGAVDEVVITGSRVVRNGYQAPTPVSVVGAIEIQRSATPNIADYVNTLPAISGSTTPQSTVSSVGAGRQGINSLNIHDIGDYRTLTLLDGRRVGGSINDGVVDVGSLPQQLISRVDVVTGGASASYGSDALSGVVNFVLDTKFTGVKGEVSGGATTYGDDKNYQVELSGGTDFAGGRGHIIVSGLTSHEDGVYNPSNRPWTKPGYAYITNPAYTATNGQPQVLLEPGVALSEASLGGAIACSATSACKSLRGIAFGPGGVPYKLSIGPIVADPIEAGGALNQGNNLRQGVNNSLEPRQNRDNVFTHITYDLNNDWTVFLEGSYSHLDTDTKYYYGGFSNTLTLHADNAYLPSSIAAQMAALGLTTVPFGTMKGDIGASGANAQHSSSRGVAGIDGKFDAFGTQWKLSAYYEYNRSTLLNTATNATNLNNWNQAIDAVKAPNGSIVCRSTLTNPNNGCVPFNLIGTGVNSAAAIAYVTGNPFQNSAFVENVASFNITGEPFSIWAGPVSLAFGAEYRSEAASGYADPITQQSTGNWDTTGGLPTIGSYSVYDGYVETVVPLAKDYFWAKSFSVNAAARAVAYNVGTYLPWKVGLEYTPPIDGIRFRAVASKDVREPNLADRYSGVFQAQSSFQNPNANGASTTATSLSTGNANLLPEIGQTYTGGVVLQPKFLPGFSASVDYYQVNITNAIGSLTVQQIVNLCYAGNQSACSLITATPGGTNQYKVNIEPLNLATVQTKGIDFEASYRFNLADVWSKMAGAVTIRGMATNYITLLTNSGIPGSIVTQTAGSYALPTWKYTLSATYEQGPVAVTGTVRGVDASVLNTAYIQCTTGCPTATANYPTYNNIQIPAATYLDLALSYRFKAGYEGFFNVRNLLNANPPIVAQGPTGYQSWTNNPVSSLNYDVLGRVFNAGVRFKF